MHIGGAATGVHEGKFASGPAMPRFWYESRRRFHALSYGRTKAALAGFAWLVGDWVRVFSSLARFRNVLSESRNERRALCSAGLLPQAKDLKPEYSRVGDPVDVPPAWMGFRQIDGC